MSDAMAEARKAALTLAARAMQKAASEFRDPVAYYVESEAGERAIEARRAAGDLNWHYTNYAEPEIDWALRSWEILGRATTDAYEAALESAGLVLVPLAPTPEQITAAQIKSELGAYACENWAEAYSTIIELYRAMIAAADPK